MFDRRFDGSDASRREPVAPQREVRLGRSARLAIGTLACPRCDAPVFPGDGPVSPAATLACPFCGESGAVRDFLSLGEPTRPARVVVRLVRRHAR
jgi:hypothetical protein